VIWREKVNGNNLSRQNIEWDILLSTLSTQRDGQKNGSTLTYGKLLVVWFYDQGLRKNRAESVVARRSGKNACGWISEA